MKIKKFMIQTVVRSNQIVICPFSGIQRTNLRMTMVRKRGKKEN